MGSYCAVSDVTSEFPSFQPGVATSVSNAQITAWIAQGGARIRASLMQRGFDPDNPLTTGANQPLSPDQSAWLSALNEDWAASKLGAVLESNVTLQPGEVSIAQQRRKQFETILGEIKAGKYDAYFGLESRLAGSTGGAETDRTTPAQRGENRPFGLNQKF
jgi:hypothetical protein